MPFSTDEGRHRMTDHLDLADPFRHPPLTYGNRANSFGQFDGANHTNSLVLTDDHIAKTVGALGPTP